MKSVAWKIFGILDSKSPKGFLGSTPKTWQEYNRRLKNSARRAQEVVLMLMGAGQSQQQFMKKLNLNWFIQETD